MVADPSHRYQEKLSLEILRKLRLAADCHITADRDIVCAEVFNDVVGSLDDTARSILGVAASCCFYEVLAAYYAKAWDAAEAMLVTCRRLWSQPYIAPVYTLLLHRWLLISSDAGGASERTKHINVLVTGARQLFTVDSNAGTAQFAALFEDLCEAVLTHDQHYRAAMPEASRVELLKLLAGYLPYYAPSADLMDRLTSLPPLSDRSRPGGAQVQDYVVTEVASMLRSLRSEAGLLRYLDALQPLCAESSSWREHVSAVPIMRLQSELYNLTVPGGPRYYPSKVRRKALAALDAAFPTGSKSRLLVSLIFRLMHPSDLPMLLWLWICSWAAPVLAYLLGGAKKASLAICAAFGFLFARRSSAVHHA